MKANARALGARLISHGYDLVSGGTDNHLVLWDLRALGLTGSKLEKLCDAAGISLNKNAVVGDRSAAAPGGVRIGTPAMTTRGMGEADFEQVADHMHMRPGASASTSASRPASASASSAPPLILMHTHPTPSRSPTIYTQLCSLPSGFRSAPDRSSRTSSRRWRPQAKSNSSGSASWSLRAPSQCPDLSRRSK